MLAALSREEAVALVQYEGLRHRALQVVAGRDLRPAIIRQFIWKCGLGLTCWAAWDLGSRWWFVTAQGAAGPRAPPRSESCLPPLVSSLVTAALVKLSQIETRWDGRSVNIAG